MTNLKMTRTDTIICHYAELPTIDTNLRYLIKVLTPYELVVREIKMPLTLESYTSFGPNSVPLEMLKIQLLNEWHKHYQHQKRAMKKAKEEWVYAVDKVELVECDLLKPKQGGDPRCLDYIDPFEIKRELV